MVRCPPASTPLRSVRWSPAHVRATASSTVDADLMVSVDGAGFASANLQDHASCWNVRSTRPADARFLMGALTR